MFYISLDVSRYHFLQFFRTSLNIIWKIFSSQIFLFHPTYPSWSKPAKCNISFSSIFPKIPFETFFFFKNLSTKSCKSIFFVSSVNCSCPCIFRASNNRLSGLFFWRYFKNSYFDKSISNYLWIEFLEFFLFYMFNLYNFIFKSLIWKMISTLILHIPITPTLILRIPTWFPSFPSFPSFRSPIPHSDFFG